MPSCCPSRPYAPTRSRRPKAARPVTAAAAPSPATHAAEGHFGSAPGGGVWGRGSALRRHAGEPAGGGDEAGAEGEGDGEPRAPGDGPDGEVLELASGLLVPDGGDLSGHGHRHEAGGDQEHEAEVGDSS